VDRVVESLELRISKSEVSCIGASLHEQVDAFRSRWREGRYPYLGLDAKVRDSGRVVRTCLVLANGVPSGLALIGAPHAGKVPAEPEIGE
jgi:putative transposase